MEHGSPWQAVHSGCVGHIWEGGELVHIIPVAVCVVYTAVIVTKGADNPKLQDCIIQGAGLHAGGREILIVKEFNGHIEDLDIHENTNGKMLLPMADQLGTECG